MRSKKSFCAGGKFFTFVREDKFWKWKYKIHKHVVRAPSYWIYRHDDVFKDDDDDVFNDDDDVSFLMMMMMFRK